MPEQDAVLVITSGVKDMQAVLNLAWQHLLPAMKPSPTATQADAAAEQRLRQRLAGLTVKPVDGSASPALDVWGKTFTFPDNPRKLQSVTLEKGENGAVTLVTKTDGVESRVVCGQGDWRRGRMARGRTPEQPVAANGAWADGNTITAKLCFYETPFVSTLRFKFEGDEVRVTSETNVGFGPTREAELVGKVMKAPSPNPQ
jgi:hypothetical protein